MKIISLIVWIFLIIYTSLIIGCIEPDEQYSDIPNPHYRPQYDVPIEP